MKFWINRICLEQMHNLPHKLTFYEWTNINNVTSWLTTVIVSTSMAPCFVSLLDIKVSSNPKDWGINKWRYFINTSNIHPQISLILLNVVSFYNICNFFADECLKMKLLIDIYALYYAESLKNADIWRLLELFVNWKWIA